jgi:hypothetical protein
MYRFKNILPNRGFKFFEANLLENTCLELLFRWSGGVLKN